MSRMKFSNLYHCFIIAVIFSPKNAVQKRYRKHADLFYVDLLVDMLQAFRFCQKLIQHKFLLMLTFKS